MAGKWGQIGPRGSIRNGSRTKARGGGSGRPTSATQIKMLRRCPQEWRFKYVDRIDVPFGSDAMDRGSCFHKAAELAVEQALEQAPTTTALSVDDILAHVAWPKPGIAESTRGLVRELGGMDISRAVATEEKIRFNLGRHTVIGYIDRRDEDRIWDYKTGHAPSRSELLDSEPAIPIYLHAAHEEWGVTKGTWWYVDHDIRHTFEWSPDTKAQVTEILEEARALQSEKATPGADNCRYCPYKDMCPAFDEHITKLAAKIETPITETNFAADITVLATKRKEMADLASMAEARKKELDAILKKHVEVNGEVDTGTYKLTLARRSTIRYPDRELTLAAVAEAAGESHEDLSRMVTEINAKALDAYIKSLPDAKQRSARAAAEETGRRDCTPYLKGTKRKGGPF